jgi:hypothetical protein
MFATTNVNTTLITMIGRIGATLMFSRLRTTNVAAIRPKTAVDAPAVAAFGAEKRYAATLPPSPAST